MPHRGGTPEPPVSLSPKVKVARPEVATDEGAGLGRVVGAALCGRPRLPELHLSPTATKALSIRGVPGFRSLPNERQRKTRNRQSAEPPAPLR